MSLTISQAAKDELAKPVPNVRRVATLIKNLFNGNTRVSEDISDRVIKWGRLVLPSSALKTNWEKPNLTMQVKNENNFLNPWSSSSFFAQSPAVDKRDVTLLVELYALKGELLTPELILRYWGYIDDVAVRYDSDFSFVEIVTVMLQNRGLQKEITKAHGGRLNQPDGTISPPGVP